MSKIDLKGKTFGRLTVLRESTKRKNRTHWECMCKCGKTKIVNGSALTTNHTKSCGCINIERLKNKNFPKHSTHKLSHHKLYKKYHDIKNRCYKNSIKSYKYYGGRGIEMCVEWKNDFLNFYNWAVSNGYNESLTIDRIDNNGNYEPNNCRFVNHKLNMQNYSHSKWWIVNDKKFESLPEAANHCGVAIRTIQKWCDGEQRTSKVTGKKYIGGKKENCYSIKKY